VDVSSVKPALRRAAVSSAGSLSSTSSRDDETSSVTRSRSNTAIDPQAVRDAAATLYEEVEGRPAA
jgi:hypothetical protein